MFWAALFVLAYIGVPLPAAAFEVNGGVSLGGILAGTAPHLAVSPHAGLLWRTEGGFLIAAQDLVSILPPINKDGAGVYNQTSVAIGYASEKANFSAGPSLSIYSMPACGVALSGRGSREVDLQPLPGTMQRRGFTVEQVPQMPVLRGP